MKSKFAALLVATSLGVHGMAVSAQATPVTAPTGLNPGDTYRLVFVTSTTRDAQSSDIADYNAFVTAAANTSPLLAALGSTWTAIASTKTIELLGSTVTVDARDNTNTNPTLNTGVNIFNLAGQSVALDNADLWDDTLLAPILYDENGSANATTVWTGSQSDGTLRFLSYMGYPATNSGLSSSSAFFWTTNFQLPWTQSHSLYAISADLTMLAQPTPEPATLSLFALGLAGLGLAKRKRHA